MSQGGEDIPANMQLLTVGQHKIKTAKERGEVAKINHGEIIHTSFYVSDETPIGIRDELDWENKKDISPEDIDEELNSRKVLYEGPGGGKYYLNSAGTKTYVKAASGTAGVPRPVEKKQRLSENSTQATSEIPRQYFMGPKGGVYYLTEKGNKVYVKGSVDAATLYTSESPATSTPRTTTPSSTGNQTRDIITGPRGGQYYINSNGNKTYIRK